MKVKMHISVLQALSDEEFIKFVNHNNSYTLYGGTKSFNEFNERYKKLNMNEIIRNDKGFPLDSDGDIDWEITEKEKREFRDRVEGKSKRRITNYTPPKKKRKK